MTEGREVKEGYPLSPGVRVRRETFGLLFYHTGSTLLTFVKSRDLLDVASDGEGHLSLFVGREGDEGSAKRERLLQTLRKKGLIIDTLTCL
jgi:putative mycofactocin binding protein MftB